MKVALIGTGLMGRPMGERILTAGYDLTVFNRSPEKAELLRSSGAEIAATPAEAVGSAECVILMLADGAAIQEVLFNSEPTADLHDRTVIQMGTISPADSVALEKKVLGRGAANTLKRQFWEAFLRRMRASFSLWWGHQSHSLTSGQPCLSVLGRNPC